MDDFNLMRHQLLLRLTAGDIDRAEYEWTLVEIERHRSTLDITRDRVDSETRIPAAEVTQIYPGMVLGNHTVKRLLGKGGMGAVWLTFEIIRDCDFFSVIKLLLPPNAAQEETRRLLNVFHKVRLLQHEHICPVYSLGYNERVGYYFVMKYVEGATLNDFSNAAQPRSAKEVMDVLLAVARGLDYAHARNIIHRDIKPSNIMMSEEPNEVHIVDFGLAARVQDVASSICGTPGYMAPEQWVGDKQDGRTDQFALGVVAYEFLAGHRPFKDEQTMVGQRILTKELPAIPSVSSVANSILARALARSKEDRFPTCVQFIEGLREAIG